MIARQKRVCLWAGSFCLTPAVFFRTIPQGVRPANPAVALNLLSDPAWGMK
jgi:hypothetical protein